MGKAYTIYSNKERIIKAVVGSRDEAKLWLAEHNNSSMRGYEVRVWEVDSQPEKNNESDWGEGYSAEDLAEAIESIILDIEDVTGKGAELAEAMVNYTKHVLEITNSGVKIQVADADNLPDLDEEPEIRYSSKQGYLSEGLPPEEQEIPEERIPYTDKEIKEDLDEVFNYLHNIIDAILDEKAHVQNELETLKNRHQGLMNYLEGEK